MTVRPSSRRRGSGFSAVALLLVLGLAGPALALLTGCASSTQLSDLELGLAALERRLEQLQSQTPTRDDIATVARALEQQVDNDVNANANLQEDLRQILAEVEALRTLIQEQRQILTATADRLDETGTDVSSIQGQLQRQGALLAALGQRQETSRPAPAAETVDPESLYDTAYQDYLGGNYEQAIVGFRDYLDTFPEGADADSAQYWIGESHLAQGRYQAAIEQLGLVAVRYPDSDKVASSMLKIGVAHGELGERELAIEMFLRVRGAYPDSDEAILALQRLDNLGAEQ